MSVKKIFWENPYLREYETEISSVKEDMITLKETIIFSSSGGQTSDTGWIDGEEVVSSKWIRGEIYYKIKKNHFFHPMQKVKLKIDWYKRYRLMKLHSTAEIILALMIQEYGNPEKIGANISGEKARIDFRIEHSIKPIIRELTDKTNKIMKNGYEIMTGFLDKEKEIRYWEIEGFAKVKCSGTHVKNVSEIGDIGLKRNNIGRNKERIEIYLK